MTPSFRLAQAILDGSGPNQRRWDWLWQAVLKRHATMKLEARAENHPSRRPGGVIGVRSCGSIRESSEHPLGETDVLAAVDDDIISARYNMDNRPRARAVIEAQRAAVA